MKPLESSDFLHGSSFQRKEIDQLETDFGLFALLKSGQEDGMVYLFDRYSKLVYSTALRVLRDTAAAEDVTQELFMQLWRKPPAIPAGGTSLAGWFVVIARNRAIGTLRKRKDTCSIDDVLMASPYDLFQEAEKNHSLERLRTAMAEFPFEQKRALDMAFFEGLTYEEIAARTGQPLGTVKSRIRKALLTLRETFREKSTPGAPQNDLLRTDVGARRRVDACLPGYCSEVESRYWPLLTRSAH